MGLSYVCSNPMVKTVSIFSENEVLEELERILASKGFTGSPLLARFLRFVVERTIRGEEQFIKEYTVGTEVFGKPPSFNPSQDASVRINAVRLRKQLSEYYQGEGNASVIRIEVPKGTYIPSFVAHNLWGENKDAYVSTDVQNNTPDFLCILPFTGFINHEAIDFSIEGFCEYISEKLSLFQDVSVMAYHSSSSYIRGGGKVEGLAGKFGVTYYLTGSIEVENNQLAVTAQLFDATSNSIIWSHAFPDNLQHNSIHAIIDNITNQIVSSLAGYSGFIHFRNFTRQTHASAFDNKIALAVFWFYHYQVHHSRAVYYEAVRQLELVLSKDASCDLCFAVLAHLYADSLIYNYQVNGNPLAKAQEYVNKALVLNPNSQHAFLVQAWIDVFQHNKESALKNVEHCVSINPNSSYFKASFSLGLSFFGEYERSMALRLQTLSLNPLPYWWMNVPGIFVALRNHEYEKMLFLARKWGTPADIFEHVFEMIALYYLEDVEQLRQTLKQYQEKFPTGLEFVVQALPVILFDEHLVSQITEALEQIILLSNGSPKNEIK